MALEGTKVRNRIIVAVVLAVLLAASTYAQTTNFFELVKTGTLRVYKLPSTRVRT